LATHHGLLHHHCRYNDYHCHNYRRYLIAISIIIITVTMTAVASWVIVVLAIASIVTATSKASLWVLHIAGCTRLCLSDFKFFC
jgi:hypothetical protein